MGAAWATSLIHDVPPDTDDVERMMTEAGDILGRLGGTIRRLPDYDVFTASFVGRFASAKPRRHR